MFVYETVHAVLEYCNFLSNPTSIFSSDLANLHDKCWRPYSSSAQSISFEPTRIYEYVPQPSIIVVAMPLIFRVLFPNFTVNCFCLAFLSDRHNFWYPTLKFWNDIVNCVIGETIQTLSWRQQDVFCVFKLLILYLFTYSSFRNYCFACETKASFSTSNIAYGKTSYP